MTYAELFLVAVYAESKRYQNGSDSCYQVTRKLSVHSVKGEIFCLLFLQICPYCKGQR